MGLQDTSEIHKMVIIIIIQRHMCIPLIFDKKNLEFGIHTLKNNTKVFL